MFHSCWAPVGCFDLGWEGDVGVVADGLVVGNLGHVIEERDIIAVGVRRLEGRLGNYGVVQWWWRWWCGEVLLGFL